MSRGDSHELLPIAEWLQESDEGFELLDPVHGRPLVSAENSGPPEFLTEDSRLKDGLDYAAAFAGSWVLGINYTAGETVASDIDDEFEDVARDPTTISMLLVTQWMEH